jgi:putative membrane protein
MIMKVPTRILLGVGVVLAVSATAMAQTPAAGSGIKVTKEKAPATTTTTTTTTSTVTTVRGGEVTLTPPFSLSIYGSQLTEANLINHLIMGDSIEIRIAQLAQTKASDQRVRDYATMLVTDHRDHLMHALHVMTDEKIGNVPFANDVEAQRMQSLLTNLTNMAAGSAWDALFVRAQVQHHQNELDILNANLKNAHNEDLEDLVEHTIGAVTKHRDAGKSLATTIGISLY